MAEAMEARNDEPRSVGLVERHERLVVAVLDQDHRVVEPAQAERRGGDAGVDGMPGVERLENGDRL